MTATTLSGRMPILSNEAPNLVLKAQWIKDHARDLEGADINSLSLRGHGHSIEILGASPSLDNIAIGFRMIRGDSFLSEDGNRSYQRYRGFVDGLSLEITSVRNIR